MRTVLLAGLVVSAVALAACSSSTPKATNRAATTTTSATEPTTTTTVAPTTTTTIPPTPHLAVSVAYFYWDTEFKDFRFVAPVENSGSQAVEDAQTAWTAYSATGAIVGSFTEGLPEIPAHSTWYYVGGAGSALLSGTPSRVTVVVSTAGQYTTQAPLSTFKVGASQISQDAYPLGSSGLSYTVTADVTVGGSATVNSASLVLPIVLRSATGAIVGADFDEPTNLPSTLAPGAVFSASDDISATGTASSANVYVEAGG